MDSITHILITRALVGRRRATLLTGIAPALPFYSTYPLWVASRHQLTTVLETGIWPAPPSWTVVLHRSTHSVLLALLGAILIRVWCGYYPQTTLVAWLLHLIIDIPTHTRDPWGPRPLWPISDIAYNGIGWAEALTHLIVVHVRQDEA